MIHLILVARRVKAAIFPRFKLEVIDRVAVNGITLLPLLRAPGVGYLVNDTMCCRRKWGRMGVRHVSAPVECDGRTKAPAETGSTVALSAENGGAKLSLAMAGRGSAVRSMGRDKARDDARRSARAALAAAIGVSC